MFNIHKFKYFIAYRAHALVAAPPLVQLLRLRVQLSAALLDLRGRSGDDQLAQIEPLAVLLAAFSLL